MMLARMIQQAVKAVAGKAFLPSFKLMQIFHILAGMDLAYI